MWLWYTVLSRQPSASRPTARPEGRHAGEGHQSAELPVHRRAPRYSPEPHPSTPPSVNPPGPPHPTGVLAQALPMPPLPPPSDPGVEESKGERRMQPPGPIRRQLVEEIRMWVLSSLCSAVPTRAGAVRPAQSRPQAGGSSHQHCTAAAYPHVRRMLLPHMHHTKPRAWPAPAPAARGAAMKCVMWGD